MVLHTPGCFRITLLLLSNYSCNKETQAKLLIFFSSQRSSIASNCPILIFHASWHTLPEMCKLFFRNELNKEDELIVKVSDTVVFRIILIRLVEKTREKLC